MGDSSTSIRRQVSHKLVNSIKRLKAELHFFVESMEEDDILDVTFPGNRNDNLVLRINGHVEHRAPLPRTIYKIKCDKQFLQINQNKQGCKIVITVYKSNNEDDWPSKDAHTWGLVNNEL